MKFPRWFDLIDVSNRNTTGLFPALLRDRHFNLPPIFYDVFGANETFNILDREMPVKQKTWAVFCTTQKRDTAGAAKRSGWRGERSNYFFGQPTQGLLQPQAAPIDARFDRAYGAVDDLGDFLVRESVQIAEEHGGAKF